MFNCSCLVAHISGYLFAHQINLHTYMYVSTAHVRVCMSNVDKLELTSNSMNALEILRHHDAGLTSYTKKSCEGMREQVCHRDALAF